MKITIAAIAVINQPIPSMGNAFLLDINKVHFWRVPPFLTIMKYVYTPHLSLLSVKITRFKLAFPLIIIGSKLHFMPIFLHNIANVSTPGLLLFLLDQTPNKLCDPWRITRTKCAILRLFSGNECYTNFNSFQWNYFRI